MISSGHKGTSKIKKNIKIRKKSLKQVEDAIKKCLYNGDNCSTFYRQLLCRKKDLLTKK